MNFSLFINTTQKTARLVIVPDLLHREVFAELKRQGCELQVEMAGMGNPQIGQDERRAVVPPAPAAAATVAAPPAIIPTPNGNGHPKPRPGTMLAMIEEVIPNLPTPFGYGELRRELLEKFPERRASISTSLYVSGGEALRRGIMIRMMGGYRGPLKTISEIMSP